MIETPVFIGIDLACAKQKRLPVCVSTLERDCLNPISIPRRLADDIPRGIGNSEIASVVPFREVAIAVANAIEAVCREMSLRPIRIAIDAPAAPPATGARTSEQEMGVAGLSSFRTPDADGWRLIRERCSDHLRNGLRPAYLPFANVIWMLYGFELFPALRGGLACEVIETYPFAIVRQLLAHARHKSTVEGYRSQLEAVSKRTGWQPDRLEARLTEAVPGTRHDRLDAFMACWVASLPVERRRAFGNATNADDAIWVPRVGEAAPIVGAAS